MEIKNNLKRYEISLGLLSCLLVVFPKLIVLGIAAVIIFLVHGIKQKQFKFQIHPLSLFFVIFYLTYLIGVFFTHNQELAKLYVENKLSFLIFPLIFAFQPKNDRKIDYKWAYVGFIVGTTIISIAGIASALNCFIQSGDKLCLFTISISPFHHPSYLSVYLTFSLVIVILGLYKKWHFFNFKWGVPFIFFAVFLQAFLLSLAGLLFLFISLGSFIIFIIYRYLGLKSFLLSVIIIPILVYLALTKIPQVNGEWYNAKKHAAEFFDEPEHYVETRMYPMEGTAVRITMWITSCLIIKEHIFGVGTGNVDEYLEKKLIQLKQPELAKHYYNPHNQFLQTFIEIGFFGFLILLSITIFTVYFGIYYKNILLIILGSSLFFNSLFESMLQRQSGIVFFSFWICLLVSQYNFKKKIE